MGAPLLFSFYFIRLDNYKNTTFCGELEEGSEKCGNSSSKLFLYIMFGGFFFIKPQQVYSKKNLDHNN